MLLFDIHGMNNTSLADYVLIINLHMAGRADGKNPQKIDPSLPLRNTKHEQVIAAMLRGLSGTKAYASVYGEAPGCGVSASRLLRNELFRARLDHLRNTPVHVTGTIIREQLAHELRDRTNRLEKLGKLADGLAQTIVIRGRLYYDVLANQQPKYMPAVIPEMPVAPGDIALVKELRGVMQQIAQDAGQWTEKFLAAAVPAKRLIGVTLDEF